MVKKPSRETPEDERKSYAIGEDIVTREEQKSGICEDICLGAM